MNELRSSCRCSVRWAAVTGDKPASLPKNSRKAEVKSPRLSKKFAEKVSVEGEGRSSSGEPLNVLAFEVHF